jgi:hypothetical protein
MIKCSKCKTENDNRALVCTGCKTSLLPGYLTRRDKLMQLLKASGVLTSGIIVGALLINLMFFKDLLSGSESGETPTIVRVLGFALVIGASYYSYNIARKAIKSNPPDEAFLSRAAMFSRWGDYDRAATDAVSAVELVISPETITDLEFSAAGIYAEIHCHDPERDLTALKQPLQEKFSRVYQESQYENIRRLAAIGLAQVGDASATIELLEESIAGIESGEDNRRYSGFPLGMAEDLYDLRELLEPGDFLRLKDLLTDALTRLSEDENNRMRESARIALEILSRGGAAQ